MNYEIAEKNIENELNRDYPNRTAEERTARATLYALRGIGGTLVSIAMELDRLVQILENLEKENDPYDQ